MAETKNVYIQRDVASSKIRTGVANVALRNGDIVAIGTKTKGVYTLSAPKADTTLFGIVYNADVVTEGNYRGLSDDPRDISFNAGTIVNFYIPEKMDEIAITVATNYVSGTSKYLVPTVDSTGYTASATPSDKLNYVITGTSYISIGDTRVATIEATCTVA